jgi:hypothetical protein
MARPSVNVSVFRLVSVALVLILAMNWVGRQIRKSMENHSLQVVEDWPTRKPDEQRRVYSLDGLSIVTPEGWRASISPNTIRLVGPEVPRGYMGPSEIQVNKVTDPYRHPFPLPHTNAFQDGYACVKILHVRSTPYEPSRHEGHVVVERSGGQYEIIFRSYKYFTKRIPDRIWRYLETFDIEEKSLTASLDRFDSSR